MREHEGENLYAAHLNTGMYVKRDAPCFACTLRDDHCKSIGCTSVVLTASSFCSLHAELAKHIKDMEILITTPFHPAYMNKERLEKASKLKLIMTAGVGSDHIDLKTAADKGMTIVEVSGVQTKSAACPLYGSLQLA